MKHIKQPTKTSCGQTCLAMIAGITPEEVFKLLPDTSEGARPKQLRAIAPLLGFLLGRPGKTPLVIKPRGVFIARVIIPIQGVRSRRGWTMTSHFIVYDCNPRAPIIHDPSQNQRENAISYLSRLEQEHSRLISLMRVWYML